MNVGDRVTVVWGFPPETWQAEVLSLPDHRGRALLRPVNADSGASLLVPIEFIDTATITVARSTGHMHRATDPETSRLAAEATARELNANQWKILASLVEAGHRGLIDHAHEDRTGLAQDSAGKRRKELERLGLTEPTGERLITPRGSYANVHRATARGIAVYQQHRQGAA
jgi:hypothetical protein